jgi:carbonic anhydrase/acetyltransferase-like protein (isoleucine patch superfamily)
MNKYTKQESQQLEEQSLIPASTTFHPSVSILGQLLVGEHSKVGQDVQISSEDTTLLIGSFVTVHNNVRIESYGIDGPTFICNGVVIKSDARICNAHIQENSLIGSGAILMNGSYIGEHAVIGANTIITPYTQVQDHQVCEPNAIYAGIPAIKIANLQIPVSTRLTELFNSNNSIAS